VVDRPRAITANR